MPVEAPPGTGAAEAAKAASGSGSGSASGMHAPARDSDWLILPHVMSARRRCKLLAPVLRHVHSFIDRYS